MRINKHLKVVCVFVLSVFCSFDLYSEKPKKGCKIHNTTYNAVKSKIGKEKLSKDKANAINERKKSINKSYDALQKISKSIRKIERELVELNKVKIYYGTILESSYEAIKQKDAFIAKNIDDIKNCDPALQNVFTSNKNVVSKCWARIEEINKSICSLQNKLKRNDIEIKNLESNITKQRAKLLSEYKKIDALVSKDITKEKDKRDVINYAEEKASSLTDLLERIRFEVSVGRFKDFPVCKVDTCEVALPVEFFLSKNLDSHTPYKATRFLVKNGSDVFAPISGVVVFSKNYKNNGNVVILNNTKCGCVMLYGLGSSFVKIGDLVRVGQVIGEAQASILLGFSEVFLVHKHCK